MANFHDEAVAKTLSMALSRDITAFSCEHKRSDLVPYMKLFGIKCGFKIDKQPLLSLFASLRTWVFGSDHLPILGPALHGRELLCTWIISGKLLPPLLADAVQGIRCHLGDWMQLLQKLFEDGLDLFLGFDSTPKRSLSLDYYPRKMFWGSSDAFSLIFMIHLSIAVIVLVVLVVTTTSPLPQNATTTTSSRHSQGPSTFRCPSSRVLWLWP